MFFRFQARPDYSDGEIDLIPLYIPRRLMAQEFGQEKVWRITEHGKRQEIGQIAYRSGESRAIYYFGHIGYHIDPPWRGRHFAAKACALIADEIRRSGKSSVVITCDPDNAASRKTCESLGCLWESEVTVEGQIREKFDISARKERYIWRLQENTCLRR